MTIKQLTDEVEQLAGFVEKGMIADQINPAQQVPHSRHTQQQPATKPRRENPWYRRLLSGTIRLVNR